VHPDNPQASAPRDLVADAFLRKTTDWPDGQGIRPVDLPASSATRARFSETVLKRSVAAVKHYWQQIIFSGRGVPPPELESDAAVIGYVLQHRGAIGYVSGSADLGKAKVLVVR
jgi:ABC-type phosphate transport system substrate-binding protein